jgi:hypothetical protein
MQKNIPVLGHMATFLAVITNLNKRLAFWIKMSIDLLVLPNRLRLGTFSGLMTGCLNKIET